MGNVCSLLGSDHINTRSMHSDSGLAAPDTELAKTWGEELWNLHRHVPQETITAKLVSALYVAITKKGGYP